MLFNVQLNSSFLWALLLAGWFISPAAAISPHVEKTLAEKAESADVAVICHLKFVEVEGGSAVARFVFDDTLRGKEFLGETMSLDHDELIDTSVGDRYLLLGRESEDSISWRVPTRISANVAEYLQRRVRLPQAIKPQLEFYLPLLEHEEQVIAEDVANQLNKFTEAELALLKSKFKNDQLIAWTETTDIPLPRKQLYYRMLGVSGKLPEQLYLRRLLVKGEADNRCLNAVMSAYLQLGGVDAANELRKRYIEDPNAGMAEVYCAILAFRHDTRVAKSLPRETRLAAYRAVVRIPNMADLVISDLAFEKDWSMIEPLAELFVREEGNSSWTKIPTIRYLWACPLDEAKEMLKELEAIDPVAFNRARKFKMIP